LSKGEVLSRVFLFEKGVGRKKFQRGFSGFSSVEVVRGESNADA